MSVSGDLAILYFDAGNKAQRELLLFGTLIDPGNSIEGKTKAHLGVNGGLVV